MLCDLLNRILNSNDFVNGLFVIFGGLIAAVTSITTTLFSEGKNHKNEINRMIRDKREKIYIDLTGALFKLIDSGSEKGGDDFTTFLQFYLDNRPELNLYASSQIRDELEVFIIKINEVNNTNVPEFIEQTRRKSLHLVNNMRTELLSGRR
ncbi:MAG: hypothetical protein ACERKO_03820 [Acetanaerobacterium sp.]